MDKIITTFVDNGLEWLRQKDLLERPDPNMPLEMIDPARQANKDWRPWKAIQSSVTDSDLDDLRKKIGRELPPTYNDFLKYKHFYEIHSTAGFRTFPHLIHRWKKELTERLLESEWKEFMLDRGLIWFGNYHDHGFLCFDTNRKKPNNEYSVVLVDHEDPEDAQIFHSNFLELLKENTVAL